LKRILFPLLIGSLLASCAPTTGNPTATALPFKEGEVWRVDATATGYDEHPLITVGKPHEYMAGMYLFADPRSADFSFNFSENRDVITARFITKSGPVGYCLVKKPASGATAHAGRWMVTFEHMDAYLLRGETAGTAPCTITRVSPTS